MTGSGAGGPRNRLIAAVVAAACGGMLGIGAGLLTAPGAGAADAVGVLGPPPPTAPVVDRDAPDPDIVRVDGLGGTTTYYAYTTASGGQNVPVMSSPDLRNWTLMRDALPTLPSWSVPGHTWAPGVVQLGSTFVMYYSTDVATTGQLCISVATSTSPSGPFSDTSGGPLVCQAALGGSIDPSPFVDADGALYLYWKSNGDPAGLPSQLWVAPLAPDGRSLAGAAVSVLGEDQSWESTVESPAVVRVGAQYVLFYSGGWWAGAGYGVGYALCQGPQGPCTKPLVGPLLTSDRYRLGPGGQSLFSDAEGDLFMAYGAWDGPVNAFSYRAGDFRSMWVAQVTFSGATPVIHAGEPQQGYLLAASDGGAFAFGAQRYAGSMGGRPLVAPVVGAATDPASGGYREVAADGGIFAFGGAGYFGSMGGRPLVAPVVGMASTPDGGGYWLVARDGGIFAFGAAPWLGSAAGTGGAPMVAVVAGPGGGGYRLVGSDGSVDVFGDTQFLGSLAGSPLAAPVVAAGSS